MPQASCFELVIASPHSPLSITYCDLLLLCLNAGMILIHHWSFHVSPFFVLFSRSLPSFADMLKDLVYSCLIHDEKAPGRPMPNPCADHGRARIRWQPEGAADSSDWMMDCADWTECSRDFFLLESLQASKVRSDREARRFHGKLSDRLAVQKRTTGGQSSPRTVSLVSRGCEREHE